MKLALPALVIAIPDNASYVFKAVDAGGQPVKYDGVDTVYTLRVPRRPLTMTETLAVQPHVMTSSVPFAEYKGGPLTLSVAGVNPDFATHVVLSIADAMFQTVYSDEVDVAPQRTGTASHAFTLPFQRPTGPYHHSVEARCCGSAAFGAIGGGRCPTHTSGNRNQDREGHPSRSRFAPKRQGVNCSASAEVRARLLNAAGRAPTSAEIGRSFAPSNGH